MLLHIGTKWLIHTEALFLSDEVSS